MSDQLIAALSHGGAHSAQASAAAHICARSLFLPTLPRVGISPGSVRDGFFFRI